MVGARLHLGVCQHAVIARTDAFQGTAGTRLRPGGVVRVAARQHVVDDLVDIAEQVVVRVCIRRLAALRLHAEVLVRLVAVAGQVDRDKRHLGRVFVTAERDDVLLRQQGGVRVDGVVIGVPVEFVVRVAVRKVLVALDGVAGRRIRVVLVAEQDASHVFHAAFPLGFVQGGRGGGFFIAVQVEVVERHGAGGFGRRLDVARRGRAVHARGVGLVLRNLDLDARQVRPHVVRDLDIAAEEALIPAVLAGKLRQGIGRFDIVELGEQTLPLVVQVAVSAGTIVVILPCLFSIGIRRLADADAETGQRAVGQVCVIVVFIEVLPDVAGGFGKRLAVRRFPPARFRAHVRAQHIDIRVVIEVAGLPVRPV